MMSGGVCCAEISRMFSDPVGDDRSRMDVWKRTSELSGRIESFSQNYEKKKDKPYADTIGKDLPELKWRGKMNPLICEPGELLEIGDREGVVRLLEYHLKRLDVEIEKRTAETSEKKKLGSWLGAAGGIFLVILLL